MAKTVYWAPMPLVRNGNHDWPLVSELKVHEPERLIKRINPIEFFGPETAKCPAMVDELKNIFAVKSSLDLHIDFGKDFDDPICHNEDYNWNFISQLTNPPNPHKIFQLDYSGIIFFCEDPLVVTQVHPFYEDTAFTDSVMGVTGSYDISKWVRPVTNAFKFKNNKHVLNIKDGDVLMYYKFNTAEAVKLKRFDATQLHRNYGSVLNGCLSFKEHKPRSFAYSLQACYDAFKRAGYNKKMMKYINENLLD